MDPGGLRTPEFSTPPSLRRFISGELPPSKGIACEELMVESHILIMLALKLSHDCRHHLAI